MRLLRTLAFILIALPCALAASQNLPTVSAYALDREKVTLPKDFQAPLNLLVLSFQRDQQSVVDGWLPAVAGPGVQTWWLPISARENGVYRWWLNASLRGSLAASQQRRFTVPLYVNKTQFYKALGISSEQDVVLLLTDKAGNVLWRTSGTVSDGKKAAVNGFVSRSTSH